MTRQLSNQTQQPTSTTSPLSSGILQRKCVSCGQHTIAGGECGECQKKRMPLQRRAINGENISDVPPLDSYPFRKSCFHHDFSHIPVHTAAPVLIQPKLAIGAVGDRYEQEADRMADEVMRMPEPTIQRQVEPEEQEEEEEMVQKKAIASPISPVSKGQEEGEVPPIVADVLRSPGQPLDTATRSFMERRFGQDFSLVQVYTNAQASASAKALNARAYTVGQRIVFGAESYSPGTLIGNQLLAHELTHTLQQREISHPKTVQRSPEDLKVPAINEPESMAEWESPTGEDFQWQNPALLETSFPERANGLRSFLMVVKELEFRGYLGTSVAIAKKEVQAALNAYLADLKVLDEKQLLEKVNEFFEQYKDTDAFPAWLKDAVINYSGMKYKSAHGSYFSPKQLLLIIKTHELNTADKDEKEMMLAEASKVLQDESTLDILPGKTSKKLKSDLAASSLKNLSKRIPKKEQDAFVDLITKEDSLWDNYLELQHIVQDSDAFTEALQTIQQKEDELNALEPSFSKKSWKQIQRKRTLKKDLLLKIYREIALQKIRKLNNLQAVQLLDEIHESGLIPEEAWKEIMSHTELRVKISAPDELVTTKRALKGVERDPVIAEGDWQLWKSLLKEWYTNGSTGWREEHRQTLSSAIVTTLVCDQLGSVIQHVRGVSAPGGLRKNAMAYYKAASEIKTSSSSTSTDVKTAFPAGPSEPFFKKPASIADFPVGASIFWTKWSDVSVTNEYMKIYNEEERLKKDIRFFEGQIQGFKEKKKQTEKDKTKIENYAAKIQAHNARLKELENSQQSMHIYTPEKDKTPDISNIVSLMEGEGRQLMEKGKVITDCMSDGKWTYSINAERKVGKSKVPSIMRAQPNPYFRKDPLKCPDDFTEGQDKNIVKQWLVWQHEATVMYVIPDQNKVVTFDTSFKLGKEEVKALGPRIREVSDLVDNDRVFVGYMPEKYTAHP